MKIADRTIFIPECGIDTAITIVLLNDDKKTYIDHKHGNTKVNRGFISDKRKGWKIIGVTDNDKKNKPEYFAEFKVKESNVHFDYLSHPKEQHHLIFCKPAADRLLFNACQEAKISPTEFGFSDIEIEFIKSCKKKDIEKDVQMIKLIKALKKAKAPTFVQMQKVIEQIIAQN